MNTAASFKFLAALTLLMSASNALAFNETICSGLVNGEEVAHATRVNPYEVNGVEFYRDKHTSVILDMDPAREQTELRLRVIDLKTKQVLATAPRESREMGSKVDMDQLVKTFSGRSLKVQITCENEYGD